MEGVAMECGLEEPHFFSFSLEDHWEGTIYGSLGGHNQ